MVCDSCGEDGAIAVTDDWNGRVRPTYLCRDCYCPRDDGPGWDDLLPGFVRVAVVAIALGFGTAPVIAQDYPPIPRPKPEPGPPSMEIGECAPAAVAEAIAESHGERLVAVAVVGPQRIVAHFAGPRSWTSFMRYPDGKTCLLSFGSEWIEVKPKGDPV